MLFKHTPCPISVVVDVNEEATAVVNVLKHTPCPVSGVVDVLSMKRLLAPLVWLWMSMKRLLL